MKVLIVEDEKKIASFIKRGLSEEGYSVDIAYDGLEGLDKAMSSVYDIVIIDIMLPKMDGIELCSYLRKKGFNNPILILTARDRVEDKVKGLDSGANDYLTKPFAFEELLARLRALTRKSNNQAKTNIKIADLEIDLISHKVKRGGKEIPLTVKEFALLEFLAYRAGSIVTRNMISEHVWDINFDTGTNVIDVYVNYLRKKIDSNSDKKLIHTIRGRGYMLNEED
jgi:heavy metal response regulator